MINKGGRPKIKLSDLREDWKDATIELSTEGASIVELAVLLNISRDTLYALSDREPEFKKAIDNFREVSKKVNKKYVSEKVLNIREKRR